MSEQYPVVPLSLAQFLSIAVPSLAQFRSIAFPLSPRLKIHAALLAFGRLARAPSEECCRCLLTKFGLAQFAARLFWRLVNEWCLAFNIFDALPPHALAVSYS
jgi:hypothetical protein